MRNEDVTTILQQDIQNFVGKTVSKINMLTDEETNDRTLFIYFHDSPDILYARISTMQESKI